MPDGKEAISKLIRKTCKTLKRNGKIEREPTGRNQGRDADKADEEDDDDDEEQQQQVEAHVEPDGNCRLQPNVNANGNPFKRPMNALQKQWYRVLLARRVGFGQRVMQDEKEVT